MALSMDQDVTFSSTSDDQRFISFARTGDEVSLICHVDAVPADGVKRAEGPWRVFYVPGVMPFDAVGIASRLTEPLASAGISILMVSTFNTDYLLVREEDIDSAIAVLDAAPGIRLCK